MDLTDYVVHSFQMKWMPQMLMEVTLDVAGNGTIQEAEGTTCNKLSIESNARMFKRKTLE